MHTVTKGKVLMLKPSQIYPSPYQPRSNFDELSLSSLSESIAKNGIIQPLTVRTRGGGTYELIAGERRLRAAKMAGLRRVPCVLHNTDDTSAAIYCLTENLQRSDLDFFETARAIDTLLKTTGLSQSELACRLGMNKATLCNKLRILRLSPSQRHKILSAGLSEHHAISLLAVGEEKRDALLDSVIKESLSVREMNERAGLSKSESFLPEPPCVRVEFKKEKPLRKAAISDERLFANSLTKLVKTLNLGGIDAKSSRNETKRYIEYKVRIEKEAAEESARQLKIC